jgi:hypothetical protein
MVPIVRRPNVRFLTLPCALILAPALAAQDGIPQRPKLPKDADTNDAGEYVRWGNRRGTSWAKAYDAYYWAWRLEPNNWTHLYRMRRAVLLGQSNEWRLEDDRGAEYVTKSKPAKLLDSLRSPYVGGHARPAEQTRRGGRRLRSFCGPGSPT